MQAFNRIACYVSRLNFDPYGKQLSVKAHLPARLYINIGTTIAGYTQFVMIIIVKILASSLRLIN